MFRIREVMTTENANILEPSPSSSRLNGKDFINIGIFTVFYYVLVAVGGFLGFVPFFIPLLSVICPLLGGIPFMLFLTRVKKFGMISLMGTLIGLFLFLGGMGIMVFPVGIVFGVLADLYIRSGSYQNIRKGIVGYGIFSIIMMGNFLPIILNRESYAADLIAGGYGADYAATLMTVMPDWILPILLVACFVSGIAGGFIGKAALKKHFKKAGMA